jgi:hypothetical protein
LGDAGLKDLQERVPFPGSGQQQPFLERMRAALDAIDWRL